MLAWLFQLLLRSLIGTSPRRHFRLAESYREPSPNRYKPKWVKQRTLADLAKRLNVSIETLQSHKPTYAQLSIPKKSGGTRILHVPDVATKRLQRALLCRVLGPAKSHDAAMGYERGRSMVDHAKRHADRAVVIGIDLQNFFPSTRAAWVRDYFIAAGWDKEAAKLLTHLTTHENALPQGAPTSPKLSNLVNHLMDARLAGLARHFGARYTRYADDIIFSLPTDDSLLVKSLVNLAMHVIANCDYRPHWKKKLFIRRSHQRQQIAGLVVNNGPPRLSRETKRWLRAVRHRLANGKQATLTPSQLAGWDAFEHVVENT